MEILFIAFVFLLPLIFVVMGIALIVNAIQSIGESVYQYKKKNKDSR
jgi:hypothetical protein